MRKATGLDEPAIRARGAEVRVTVKELARTHPEDQKAVLTVPSSWASREPGDLVQFGRVPELSGNRDQTFKTGQSDRYHLGRMRSEPMTLPGEEAQIANAHVVNGSLLEYLGRQYQLNPDDAGMNLGGWHFSPGDDLPFLTHALTVAGSTLPGG